MRTLIASIDELANDLDKVGAFEVSAGLDAVANTLSQIPAIDKAYENDVIPYNDREHAEDRADYNFRAGILKGNIDELAKAINLPEASIQAWEDAVRKEKKVIIDGLSDAYSVIEKSGNVDEVKITRALSSAWKADNQLFSQAYDRYSGDPELDPEEKQDCLDQIVFGLKKMLSQNSEVHNFLGNSALVHGNKNELPETLLILGKIYNTVAQVVQDLEGNSNQLEQGMVALKKAKNSWLTRPNTNSLKEFMNAMVPEGKELFLEINHNMSPLVAPTKSMSIAAAPIGKSYISKGDHTKKLFNSVTKLFPHGDKHAS